MDAEKYLEQIHSDKLKELSPVIAILALMMATGLTGNVSVFIFYWRQSRRSSTTVFIMVLALTDFLVCCDIALEITDVANTYVFKNDVACKLYIYSSHIAAIASAFVLVVIAIDRYRKLCHPLRRQLTVKHAYVISIVCLLVSLLLPLPVFLLYQTSAVLNITNIYNSSFPVNGSDCSPKEEDEQTKEIIHFVFLAGFSICTVILIILYTLIGRVIYKYHKNHQTHFKRDFKQAVAQDPASTSSAGRISDNVQNVQSHCTCSENNREVITLEMVSSNQPSNRSEEEPNDTDNISRSDPSPNTSNTTKPVATINFQDRGSTSSSNHSSDSLTTTRKSDTLGRKAANKMYRKTVAAMKVTIMLFTITVVFIFSFVPYQVVSSLGHGVYKETVGFELASRSFILNSVVNPFIFGFFNTDFRRSFVNVVRCTYRKILHFITCRTKLETPNLPEVHSFNAV